MNKQAALNHTGNAVAKFLEHQTIPALSAPNPAELGKRYGEFIGGLHAELFSYYQKVQE